MWCFSVLTTSCIKPALPPADQPQRRPTNMRDRFVWLGVLGLYGLGVLGLYGLGVLGLYGLGSLVCMAWGPWFVWLGVLGLYGLGSLVCMAWGPWFGPLGMKGVFLPLECYGEISITGCIPTEENSYKHALLYIISTQMNARVVFGMMSFN